MKPLRHSIALPIVAVALAVGGCALPGGRVSPDSPLGRARALLAAEQYAEARDLLREILDESPGDERARLGLGAAFEGLGEADSATAVYASILGGTPSRGVRRRLEARLEVLRRHELQRAAREAAAAEAQLSAAPPEPGSVAVLPFQYLGADSAYAPLARALTDFFVTDLSHVGSLTLLEREAVQFLLDELALSANAIVDATTAARPGRLLRAEHVVGGSIDIPESERVRLDGNAVRTTTTEVVAAASGQDDLEQLFDVEKAVLLDLLNRMGIRLTPSERERIEERPTRNLLAVLAYGSGLEAQDRGAFAEAAAHFQEAFAADGNFAAARERADAAQAMDAAQQMTLDRVAGMADLNASELAFVGDYLNQVMGSGMSTGDQVRNPNGLGPPGGRDGIGDVGGEDRLGGFGDIRIIIRRP
jgi:TolB-like protein